MKLIVGLGNPGREYEGNRHNVGFMAVDHIAATHRFGPWKRKFQGLAADGEIGGEKLLLLKPETYMNESGRAVGEAARFLKIGLSDIVVLYDEIDLAPGQLKVKTGGGNAGHNGLRSITQHLGNDYVRVRIGVGHPGAKELVARWVLSDFAKADRTWLEPLLEAVSGAIPRLVAGDASRFLTDVQKLRGEPSDPRKGEGGRRVQDDSQIPEGEAPSRPAPSSKTHPTGDRARKRDGAIAENLKKWLEARKPKD